jgi:hypothetical protein
MVRQWLLNLLACISITVRTKENNGIPMISQLYDVENVQASVTCSRPH